MFQNKELEEVKGVKANTPCKYEQKAIGLTPNEAKRSDNFSNSFNSSKAPLNS